MLHASHDWAAYCGVTYLPDISLRLQLSWFTQEMASYWHPQDEILDAKAQAQYNSNPIVKDARGKKMKIETRSSRVQKARCKNSNSEFELNENGDWLCE